MAKSTLSLIVIIGLILIQCSTPEMEGMLLVNHVGYNLEGVKKVVYQTNLEHPPESFKVITMDGDVVFTGTFNEGGAIDQWHTGNAFAGFFTKFQTAGKYQIQIGIGLRKLTSNSFRIGKNEIADQSIPLLVQGFAGVKSEGVYEEKDRKISFFGSRSDTVDVHGGWYDASGEKGKYLSHLAFTNYMNPQQTPVFVWNMLRTAMLLADQSGSRDLIANLTEEAVFGADWLVRMQDKEGYFYQTVFAKWSWDPEQREICAYEGSGGDKTENFPSGFREGAGMTIAALAFATNLNLAGDFTSDQYLAAAVKGFDHLITRNQDYIDDGKENILDDYCALMAASELYGVTEDDVYLDHARNRMESLTARLSEDDRFSGWWRADDTGDRPYFHGAEAGLPLISLCRYLDFEMDENYRKKVIEAIQSSIAFELAITNSVNNPFGYARQYIKAADESGKKASFFFPHQNESGYWWQGENARLASLASAFNLAIPYSEEIQQRAMRTFAADQVNWILGINPYDVCMLQGTGRNNPDYREGEESLNIQGGVCNGITSGFENEHDIAFMPLPQNDDLSHRWRWSEQWTLHGAWLMLAIASDTGHQ